jgi:hypothetical protein
VRGLGIHKTRFHSDRAPPFGTCCQGNFEKSMTANGIAFGDFLVAQYSVSGVACLPDRSLKPY